MKEYIAHIRYEDEKEVVQSVKAHLEQVSQITSNNASKIGLAKVGEIIGLLHDFGKYSSEFQNYIGSATGVIDQDEDDYVDVVSMKGKVDHSTAGAKYLWNITKTENPKNQAVIQLLTLCVASHHSGLIDCLTTDGKNAYEKRMYKRDEKCHLEEIKRKADDELLIKINNLLDDGEFISEVINLVSFSLFCTINSPAELSAVFWVVPVSSPLSFLTYTWEHSPAAHRSQRLYRYLTGSPRKG